MPATVWSSERSEGIYMDRPRPSDTNLGDSLHVAALPRGDLELALYTCTEEEQNRVEQNRVERDASRYV